MKSYTTAITLFFIILSAAILQMTVFSRLMLLHGAADIVLLILIAWNLQENGPNMWPWTFLAGGIISFTSALPYFVPILGYLVVTGTARLTQRRIWQTPDACHAACNPARNNHLSFDVNGSFILEWINHLIYH